ncbi:MAG TPA: class I SAM-dependent methyltransferase [Acidimicrobiia bacterium]|nr:class I SAM-dependent methyltransferase [Acidimicrobiia bacterium]
MTEGPLTPDEAARVYDRIGRFQDWQRFYEGAPMRDLEAHASFGSATAVFELGCGTGAYAQRLLGGVLAANAIYRGVDVSGHMIGLASKRIERFGDRARVDRISGVPPLPGGDHSFDRFLAVYVFDLLSDDLSVALLEEAHRLLTEDGRLCLVSLTEGDSRSARIVCSLWNSVWRRSPSLVGGCRPIDLTGLFHGAWRIDHAATVTAWAITSQIVVARPD